MPWVNDGYGNSATTNRVSQSGASSAVSVPTFSPSDSQLLAFTRISYSEQGNDAGAAAEMSLILNKYMLSGHNGDANDLYNYLYGNGWWAHSANVMDGGSHCNHPNPTEDEKQKIKAVLQGARTLPLYVDEHDWRGDIAYIEKGNGSSINDNNCYVQHQTIIHNNMGSTYTFYCFPTPESDPFGYTSQTNRDKYGDAVPADGGMPSASGSSSSGTTGYAGLTFETKPIERETARVEEGSHSGLKTFYRVNMSGVQFIKQVLAPYCRSAETGQGGYRLWFDDSYNSEGSEGSTLYFKPDQYTNIDMSMSDELLEHVDQNYQFTFGTGPESSVIDFNPDYTGIVAAIIGGNEVEASTTDAITNDVIHTIYDKYSDSQRPSTGDSELDNLLGTYRIGDSSYEINEIENKAANLWYNMKSYGYTASMTTFGDPLVKTQSVCSVAVYTPIGLPHHSSGIYLITNITDSITGGSFTSSYELIRNAIDIGVNDSGGIDITIGANTTYVGQSATLMGASSSSGTSSFSDAVGSIQGANATITSAVNWAVGIANDDSHGYTQGDGRMGPTDYDCSGLIISAYDQAGVPVKSNGASYTGNMRIAFLQSGFVEHNELCRSCDNAQVGDVYLCENKHVEMYVGNGQIVGAANNEFGGVTGGQPGDQTGKEIRVGNWWDDGWNCVLRYGS